MIVGYRDAAKLTGVSIMAFCAVVVCAMFCNFYLDLSQLDQGLLSPQAMVFYHAQISVAKVVCGVSGGCLLATSLVMLLFYCKHYIDAHKKELGILKALGYSEFRIARGFWVFGLSVLGGASLGFGAAFGLMPGFYRLQNQERILPDFPIGFHPSLLLFFVILPAMAFAALSVGYAWRKLKRPALSLLQDRMDVGPKPGLQRKRTAPSRSFLEEMRRSTLGRNKALTFFVFFSAFCFSSMTQMSLSMKDLASEMMGLMILLIGLLLACTTLLLAITTVVQGNTKPIALMRVLGYSQKECAQALLRGYRPMALLGFAVGTGYQYGLLRLMVDVVFRDVADVAAYQFDFLTMCLCLVVFAGFYETVMYYFSWRIKKVSMKEIMLES